MRSVFGSISSSLCPSLWTQRMSCSLTSGWAIRLTVTNGTLETRMPPNAWKPSVHFFSSPWEGHATLGAAGWEPGRGWEARGAEHPHPPHCASRPPCRSARSWARGEKLTPVRHWDFVVVSDAALAWPQLTDAKLECPKVRNLTNRDTYNGVLNSHN